MSKLADAIRRTVRTEPPQMGFSPTPTSRRSTMLLAALVQTPAARAPGADVVLVQQAGDTARTAGQARNGTAGTDGPLRGLWLEAGTADTAAAREQGFDFVVFDGDDAPASVLLEEQAGLVMQPPDDLSDSLLQSLQWLPLDALFVRWGGAVTVRRQLELQRLSGFSRKPLFLRLDNQPQAAELEAYREAGVIGIVVDLTTPDGAERLAALRTLIDGLRPRPKRGRDEGAIVSMTPAMIAVPAEAAEEPDEDDE